MTDSQTATEYLLNEVDKLIERKEKATPDFSLCPVGESHARDEATASLLQLKMLRISTAHALEFNKSGSTTKTILYTGLGTLTTVVTYILAKIHGVPVP